MNKSLGLLAFAAAALAACGPNRGVMDDQPAFDAVIEVGGCNAPMMVCNNVCIDPRTDRENCGACDHGCGPGSVCMSGACVVQCPSTQMMCSGTCATLATDRSNCGACGHACGAGEVCSGGMCALECGTPLVQCVSSSTADAGVDGGAHDGGTGMDGGATRYCANLQTDFHNCGACGMTCNAGAVCVSGACVTSCPTGETMCGSRCVDLTTDPSNCGACGTSCNGRVCAMGTCSTVCATGQMLCGGLCVDTTTDQANCGGCGNACPAGQVCSAGACALTCPTGTMACSGACVNTMTDPTHCGSCTTSCGAGLVCVAGACNATCAMGSMPCNGLCVNLSNDVNNCGACGNQCLTGQFCTGGACGVSCQPGQTVCGGLCVDTSVDPANCGACGLACPAGYACVGGYCAPIAGTDAMGCSSPSVMCGMNCTDIQFDNQNCGGCGQACAANLTCMNGTCVAACATGEVRCSGVCADLQTSRSNCGACGIACTSGMECEAGSCVLDPTFQVTALGTSGCNTVDDSSEAGGDNSGIAASLSSVVYAGSTATVRYNPSDVSMPTAIGSVVHTGMVNDMQDGTIYVLLDATSAEPDPFAGAVITQLGTLDPTTGALGTTRIPLTMAIRVGTGAGVFGGFGRILLHTGTGSRVTSQWFHIRTPSGIVTPLAMADPPSWQQCFNSWATWGIAEFDGQDFYALYPESNFFNVTQVTRYRVRDGMTSPAAMFTNLGTACAITFSAARSRWYYHSGSNTQFTPGTAFRSSEMGTCPGTFAMP